jgi:protocatechuate 3,4-dioxygenase beta subunit
MFKLVNRPFTATLLLTLIGASPQARGPQAATPAIRGRVVAADSGQPLPNARVAVTGTAVAVRAGLDGRFAIPAPPAAVLVVTKPGYVRMEQALAWRRDAAQSLDVRLTRSAAVAGHVTDDYGDPVVGAGVFVALVDNPDKGSPPANRRTTTDDHGDYRIGGLPAGTYAVGVRTEGAGATRVVRAPVSNAVPTTGPINPAAIGREVQMLMLPSFTTYFPGTPESGDAVPIALDAGDERHDIDFHLTVEQTARQALSVYPSVVSLRDVNIPRDGTAVVRGTVISSTGRILPHATVAIFAQAGSTFLTTSAGDDGRYAFEGLPPGAYRVAASKPGFSLPSDGVPFAPIGSSGVPVTVSADEDRARVDITLLPWGSLTGHVLDEAGEPVSGAQVGLLLSRYENGRRRLVSSSVLRRVTDDRGEFRLFGIPDGQYVLSASVIETPANSMGGYAPTFFPGTSSGAEARFITVAAGDDAKGLDFGLLPTSTARVSGTLLDSLGRPTMGGRLTLLSRSALAIRIDAIVNADGNFEFRNVPTGPWVIQADRGKLGGSVEGEFAAYPVTVGRDDVSGLTVRMSIGTSIMGRVRYDSVSGAAPAPGGISVSAIPVDFDLAPPGVAAGGPDADGAFTLSGITGIRRVQVTRLPPGWTLKSITSDGIDVTDQPLEFGRSDQAIRSFEVVLSDRTNAVSGTVTDDRARRVPGARVVVFSPDRGRWYPASRFVRSVESDGNGAFSIAGLPIGSYFVGVAPRTPAGDDGWRDPQLLDSIWAGARSISVGEADTQTVNLRVSSR